MAHVENLKFLKKSIPIGSLDFVFSSLGISHLGDVMHTLVEVGSLIKKGGFLAVNFEAVNLPNLKLI